MDNEDPYTHLSTFYELIGTMGFQEGDLEHVYMRLFPFSLAGKAKEWLKHNHKDGVLPYLCPWEPKHKNAFKYQPKA